jgi:eukaryotic-like serine/threonine-protein kinase
MTAHLHDTGDILHDRYKIDSYLAEGGMQQVYRATDLSFERSVALKLPKNESAEKRFARSARMSARVNHPNVAKTLDYFEEGGRAYLIEELIDGLDLSTAFKERFTYLDPHLAAHLMHYLAKGVAASHHAEVCHRDLKPSNIMVSNDPNLSEVRITDFGIAKLAEEEIAQNIHDEASITASQTLVGALPYMAPEVIEDHKKASKPADVWALGAMLHFFITGEPPYGVGLAAVPKILIALPPSPPSFFANAKQFRPLTEELWAIVTKCLSKAPNNRPTANELIEMCSVLCYSSAPRKSGVIAGFKYSSGSWGTITGDDGEAVFFHADSGYSKVRLRSGQRVDFACFPGMPRPRAFPVLPIN